MVDFIQNEVHKGENPELDALSELADGQPHIFLVAHDFGEDGGFGLKIQVGGGVLELNTIWHFLNKALRSIEGEMLNRGQFPTFEEVDEEEDDDADT